MAKSHIGTSAFTFQDDAGAEIHTSTVEGARHLFYGDEMTPKHQLEEVVLGPAPFGSPDVRTLGHQMKPLEDGPASAPELDADFQKLQSRSFAGRQDSGNLDSMTKDELRAHAENLGVEVNSSMTKDELREAIENNQDVDSGEDTSAEDSTDYSSMSKAELLELAESRGLDVDEQNNKAEIREALENSDK